MSEKKPANAQKMRLIASLTSPFARKVRIVAAEKRIDFDLVVDIPWKPDSQVPEYNPLGKVPVWVLEDGKALYDSRVIVEYLDSISPVGRLIPTDARARITVKRFEALADGICDAAALTYLEKKRPLQRQDPQWIERQSGKVKAGLASLSNDIGMNDAFSLADIAVGCALGYLEFRFPELDWRRSQPHLSELYDRLMRRPTFADTQPVD